uniref:Reverse transcriptase domain-containing protein n=1 Tax=Loa loa TaxID=7209 RepID=A0A1I7VWU5_LOALO
MTATRKFAHLLGCLKGEALEHISDLAVSEENYALAMKNLKERYGDKQRRIMELYTRLQKLDKSERNVVVLLRELLNILSQLKELGENLETNQLWTTISGKLPDYILGNVIKEKLKKPEWTMQDTITFLKEYIKVRDILEVTKQMQEMEIRKNARHLSKFSSQNAKFKSNSQGMKRMTICATRIKPHYEQSYTNRHEERKKRLPCIFCDGNHWNDKCDIYPTVKERVEKLKKLGLCELCMRKDHSQQTCARKLKCFHCGSEHNSALCKKQYEMKQGKDYQIDERVKESPKTVAATMVDDGSRKTYMMCKEVKLINPRETGNTIRALIFFDTGSDCNYVTESIVNKLKLRQTSSNIRMVITGMVGTRKCESRKVTFGVQTLNGNVKNVQAYTVDSILERIPYLVNEKLEKGKWGKPDVLLGVEGIADLIIRNPIKQSTGEIVMETEVGVVTGGTRKVKRGIAEVENNEFHKFKANANITKKESQLRMDQIEQTWKLEVIGIKDLMTEYQEDKALEAFQKSLTVNSEGRCVVGWPWKNQEITPAEGYGLALGRLRSTIRRLKRSPELLECYDEYFKNLLEEGVIEKIRSQNETSRISYLPHQTVVTPQKSTTKLRVVFDASAKTNEGPSLNECLYKGPVMLPLLIGILLRARQGRYLVIADVEKAFLQVSLKQEDRDVTRFLWLKDKSKGAIKENLVIFRFTRVPFGVVSSPFLLAAVIRHLLSEENSELSEEIAENLYVDNVVLTSESEAESTKMAKEAKELFKKIKMQLREFHANHDININNEQEVTDKTEVKLLGIEWNTSKDKFIWNWKILQGGLQTKRQILQFYAAIYDPLGLLGPIILPWKILIQDLWKKGMSWDEKLEQEEMRRCSELEKAFNQFNVIEVTRWIPQEYSEYMCL